MTVGTTTTAMLLAVGILDTGAGPNLIHSQCFLSQWTSINVPLSLMLSKANAYIRKG